jgi:hypothetical protein
VLVGGGVYPSFDGFEGILRQLAHFSAPRCAGNGGTGENLQLDAKVRGGSFCHGNKTEYLHVKAETEEDGARMAERLGGRRVLCLSEGGQK